MKDTFKVKVTNNTTGSLGFRSLDDKQYTFRTKGAYRNIDFYIVEGLYNEHPAYITDGYVLLSPSSVYAELGIEEELVKKLLNIQEIEKMLDNEDAETIEQVVESLPTPIKENVATVAKEKKIDSAKKQKAIKKTTGFDIAPQDDDE